MKKFHVNPDTGNVSACSAKGGNCPYGGETGTENHFDSSMDASSHAEKMLAERHGAVSTVSKSEKQHEETVQFEPIKITNPGDFDDALEIETEGARHSYSARLDEEFSEGGTSTVVNVDPEKLFTNYSGIQRSDWTPAMKELYELHKDTVADPSNWTVSDYGISGPAVFDTLDNTKAFEAEGNAIRRVEAIQRDFDLPEDIDDTAENRRMLAETVVSLYGMQGHRSEDLLRYPGTRAQIANIIHDRLYEKSGHEVTPDFYELDRDEQDRFADYYFDLTDNTSKEDLNRISRLYDEI